MFAVAVIFLDIIAYILVPPFPKEGQPGDACAFPACFIESTLELPAPHVVFVPGGGEADTGMISAQVSVSNTMLTMVLVTIIVLVALIIMSRGRKSVPGR